MTDGASDVKGAFDVKISFDVKVVSDVKVATNVNGAFVVKGVMSKMGPLVSKVVPDRIHCSRSTVSSPSFWIIFRSAADEGDGDRMDPLIEANTDGSHQGQYG